MQHHPVLSYIFLTFPMTGRLFNVSHSVDVKQMSLFAILKAYTNIALKAYCWLPLLCYVLIWFTLNRTEWKTLDAKCTKHLP